MYLSMEPLRLGLKWSWTAVKALRDIVQLLKLSGDLSQNMRLYDKCLDAIDLIAC
jgi:hypothetical protein